MAQTILPGPSYRTPGGVSSISAQVSVSALATITPIVSYVIPANTLSVGSHYRMTASGTVDNAAASPTFNWSIRVAGSAFSTVQVPSVTAAATGKAWMVTALFTARAVGASGTCVTAITALNEIATTFTAAVNIDSGGSQLSIVTTAPITIDMTMNMGAAAAGNVMRAEIASIELVRL